VDRQFDLAPDLDLCERGTGIGNHGGQSGHRVDISALFDPVTWEISAWMKEKLYSLRLSKRLCLRALEDGDVGLRIKVHIIDAQSRAFFAEITCHGANLAVSCNERSDGKEAKGERSND
jgi:hypothetical protein